MSQRTLPVRIRENVQEEIGQKRRTFWEKKKIEGDRVTGRLN